MDRRCPNLSFRTEEPLQRPGAKGQLSARTGFWPQTWPKFGPGLGEKRTASRSALGPPCPRRARLPATESPFSPFFQISTGRLLDRIGRRLVRIGRRRPQSIRPPRAGTRAALRRRRRRLRPPRPLLPGTLGRSTRGDSHRRRPQRPSGLVEPGQGPPCAAVAVVRRRALAPEPLHQSRPRKPPPGRCSTKGM